ncbi:hypothetical protein KY285_003129 [Solanum tuberosum]|nr:hypothetical protein KY284_003296 [Solanum tuberosum]KAH0767258.1 hypothetical protein KY285_003129 [Solanum tuberosum]
MAYLGFIPHTVSIIVLMKDIFKKGMSEELHQVNYNEGNMDAVFNALTEMVKDGLLPNSGKTAFCHMPQ